MMMMMIRSRVMSTIAVAFAAPMKRIVQSPSLSLSRSRVYCRRLLSGTTTTSVGDDIGEEDGAHKAHFPGAPTARFTTKLDVKRSDDVIPIYQVIDEQGRFVDPNYELKHSEDEYKKMYETMVRLNTMDHVFYDSQRQGRISFYMTSYGEEATHIGSAAALDSGDLIFAQYREAGVFMWRGFSLLDFANQCYSNKFDDGKGRQMPVHYGRHSLNVHTISSPLSTQIPQASGAAYAFKLAGKPNVVACYFGDGAASEGDFHAALNFAAVRDCPVLFFCRNNGYAISTPVKDQYRGDGIASRAIGYGMHYIRVDGNDVLAVLDATSEARRVALEQNTPVLIEAMTYRGGHHSTSDDSSRYRSTKDMRYWSEVNNPVLRTRMFLQQQRWWDSQKETDLQQSCRKEVLDALSEAEGAKKPAASQMFTDVYSDVPLHLQRQQQEMRDHVAAHPNDYNMSHLEDDEMYVDPAEGIDK